MPLASDAKSSGPPASKSGAAKGPTADVSPLPSAALVDAVSAKVADRLGGLLEKQLAAALSGASASGAPLLGTRAPPGSLAPGEQRTPQAGSRQAAAAPPPPPSPTPFGFSAPFGSGAQASGQSVFAGAPPQALAGFPVGYPGAQPHPYAAAGVAGYGNPGLAPQLPAGGLADPIPHQDLRYPLPERLARRQAQGFVLPVELWQDDEYERVVPGFSKLSPGHQSEVAYGLVSLKRVDDVLEYIQAASRGEVGLDLRRLHSVLGDVASVAGERLDGVVHLAAIKAKHSTVHPEETSEAQLAAMSEKQRKRQASIPPDGRFVNVYQREAQSLHEAVEKKVQTLIAAPHAYARVRSQYGAAAANRALGWANNSAGNPQAEDGG